MMTLTVIIVDVCVLTWLFQKIGVRCFTCGLLKSKLIYEHRRLLHLGFGRISGLMLPRKSSQNPLFRLYSVQRSTWSKWTRALEENDAKRIAAFGPPLSTVDKSLYVVSDQVQNTLATCFNESCHGILV
jgi:hypothetical protein